MTTKQLIQAVEKADSADGLLDAVKALAAAKQQEAIPTLIEVLAYNNPGAAVAAVDGLIDLGLIAVPYILEKLDGYNYGARAWATRALAGIGSPDGFDLLLEAATTDFSLSVRRAAAKGLGLIRWGDLPAEKIIPSQEKAVQTLIVVVDDQEWVVRYAAVVGLEAILFAISESQVILKEKILQRFNLILDKESELVVRARVKLVLQRLLN